MFSIQQLDVIDGDGAVMILYERLVQLCNGSNVEAAADTVEKTKQSDGYHISESSPYTLPQHASHFKTY